jgi:iron-sulfur cluster insertion protein
MTNSNTLLNITDSAKQHLIKVSNEEGKPYVLFGVSGGGCSGFQYYWNVGDNYDPEGELIELGEGAYLAVDELSCMYVAGSIIDYVTSLAGSQLVVENPLAQSSCGCGASVGF